MVIVRRHGWLAERIASHCPGTWQLLNSARAIHRWQVSPEQTLVTNHRISRDSAPLSRVKSAIKYASAMRFILSPQLSLLIVQKQIMAFHLFSFVFERYVTKPSTGSAFLSYREMQSFPGILFLLVLSLETETRNIGLLDIVKLKRYTLALRFKRDKENSLKVTSKLIPHVPIVSNMYLWVESWKSFSVVWRAWCSESLNFHTERKKLPFYIRTSWGG